VSRTTRLVDYILHGRERERGSQKMVLLGAQKNRRLWLLKVAFGSGGSSVAGVHWLEVAPINRGRRWVY